MHYYSPTLRYVPTHLSLGILESPEGKSDVFYPPPLFPLPSLPPPQSFPNCPPGCPITGLFLTIPPPASLSLPTFPSPAFPPSPLPPLPLLPPPHLQSRSWMTTRQHYYTTIVVLQSTESPVATNDCRHSPPPSPHLTPFPHHLPPSGIPSMMSKVPAGVRDSPLDSPWKNWRSDCQHIT